MILLVLTIITSFLTFYTKGIVYENYFGFLMFFGPGIFYSIYLLSAIDRPLHWLYQIAIYFLFILIWLLSFYLSFISWGVGVPILASVSALLITKIMYFKNPQFDDYARAFMVVGLLTGTMGIIGFSMSDLEMENFNYGFVWIVLFWQVGMGGTIEYFKLKKNS